MRAFASKNLWNTTEYNTKLCWTKYELPVLFGIVISTKVPWQFVIQILVGYRDGESVQSYSTSRSTGFVWENDETISSAQKLRVRSLVCAFIFVFKRSVLRWAVQVEFYYWTNQWKWKGLSKSGLSETWQLCNFVQMGEDVDSSGEMLLFFVILTAINKFALATVDIV